VKRSVGYLSLGLAAVAALVGVIVATSAPIVVVLPSAGAIVFNEVVAKLLFATAVVLGFNGLYLLVFYAFIARSANKRRAHDARNVLRLLFGLLAVIGVLGVISGQWLGVLFSLGVVGFAVTFALQQPLLSLLAWGYIMINRPYAVGDRIEIDGSKGDVIEVDFLVTTLWEINGDLVTSNQPSGRVITVPNSVVLSSQVVNFGGAGFPYVWNEISIQLSYETDLDFARETMAAVGNDFLGDEMAAQIARYRELLATTAVELEVADRPTVNVAQRETWVELRLRYLVHPRRGQRVKNELYRRVLAAFNEHPDRVSFPVGRNR
jgi:small-conductance mechanosensitive channel